MTDSNGSNCGRVRRFLTSAKAWTGLAATCLGLYISAPALGWQPPRWAWHHELVAQFELVMGRAEKNEIAILENSLRNLKAERRQIAREKREAVEQGGTPHPRLVEDELENREALQAVRDRLKRIRGF